MDSENIPLEKILSGALIGIAAIIAAGTIIAFASGKTPGKNYRRADPESVEQIKGADEDIASFKEFGTLRAITKSEKDSSNSSNGTVIVLTPWFSIKTDSAFREELVHKKKLLSAIMLEYFSAHTRKELLSLGEKQVKEDLLALINSHLVLGQVLGIYFDDYMFL